MILSQTHAKVPILYINRVSDLHRRTAVERSLAEAGLSGERITAIEGGNVPPSLASVYFPGVPGTSRLTPGEVGCYASHLLALQHIVDEKLPYALVLEDDAILPKDLKTKLAQAVLSAPPDWDMIRLCRDPKHAVKPVKVIDGLGTLVRYSRAPYGAVAYLISRNGAIKFLKSMPRMWPVDTDFRQPWVYGLSVYGVVPSPISHADWLPSTIHQLGGPSRLRRGLPIPRRGCLTGSPLHTPWGFVHNLRALGATWWLRCFTSNACKRFAKYCDEVSTAFGGALATNQPNRQSQTAVPSDGLGSSQKRPDLA